MTKPDLFSRYKPGHVYYDVEGPVTFGNMGVRSELAVLPEATGPSFGACELEEYGSSALRLYGVPSEPDYDTTIDSTWTLVVGGFVLVRALAGGWFVAELKKDRRGWYVLVGHDDYRLDVTFDDVRARWVVKELR